jgi:hypothetical protein
VDCTSTGVPAYLLQLACETVLPLHSRTLQSVHLGILPTDAGRCCVYKHIHARCGCFLCCFGHVTVLALCDNQHSVRCCSYPVWVARHYMSGQLLSQLLYYSAQSVVIQHNLWLSSTVCGLNRLMESRQGHQVQLHPCSACFQLTARGMLL